MTPVRSSTRSFRREATRNASAGSSFSGLRANERVCRDSGAERPTPGQSLNRLSDKSNVCMVESGKPGFKNGFGAKLRNPTASSKMLADA